MSINLAFDSQRWTKVFADWQDWWDGRLERPLVLCEGYPPGWLEQHPDAPPRPNWTFTGRYPQDMPIGAVVDRYQEALEAGFFAGDALPKFYVNVGPGALAAFLGAHYQLLPDTTWFYPPNNQAGVSWEDIPLDQLHLTFDEQHLLWQRVFRLTCTAMQRWAGKLVIGITDLGGNLDVLASLIGAQRLAVELLDHPDEIERLCAEIRCAWLDCYERLHTFIESGGMGSSCWASIWAPQRSYMFQSDFAYMISPTMFRRYVIPDLQECCRAIPYSFYHLDGKGQIRHLDQLLTLEELRGIQWIPGDGAPPPEDWMPLLKRIRDAGKLCQLYVSAAGARRIIDELGGKGFALDINDDLTHEQAKMVVEELCQ